MTFLRTHRKSVYIFLITFFLILVLIFLLLCSYAMQRERAFVEETEKLNQYFNEYQNGFFEAGEVGHGINTWPKYDTSVWQLRRYLHLLRTEQDKKRVPADVGFPLFIFTSSKEAWRYYNRLTEEEKGWYMVISQSVVYIRYYRNEQELEVLREAQNYFDNHDARSQIY